jgi:hypothetical protein
MSWRAGDPGARLVVVVKCVPKNGRLRLQEKFVPADLITNSFRNLPASLNPRFCAEGRELMSKKPRRAATSVTAGNVPAPVRVRLRRINSEPARPYPPDGQAGEWWQRLKDAFGTTSSALVDASLQQLIGASSLSTIDPCGRLRW